MRSQKNASMIRLLLLGIIISIALFGCVSTSSFIVVQQAEVYIENQEYQFSYVMPGDYVISTSIKRNGAKLQKRLAALNLSDAKLLMSLQTNVEPYHTQYVLKLNSSKHDFSEQHNTIKKAHSLITGDSDNFKIYNNEALTWKRYKVRGQNEIAIIGATDRNNSHSLMSEYRKIFSSFKTGKDFKQDILDDPMNKAMAVGVTPDSLVNYLLPIELLAQIESNYRDSTRYSFLQAAGTFKSFIHSYDLHSTIQEFRSDYYFGLKGKNNPQLDSYDQGAIDILLSRTSQTNLVMFNENHFDPSHRLFVKSLLSDLYDQGYRYLGLEALWEDSDTLMRRGFAVTKSGFYTREPNYSNLIREAVDIGFKVFGYDEFLGDREEGQADNIYEQTFKFDWKRKVVILAGFGHIHEGRKSDNSKRPMMAEIFKKKYDIDPLTIDQTEFYGHDGKDIGLVDPNSISAVRKITADMYIINNLGINDKIDQLAPDYQREVEGLVQQGAYAKIYILANYNKSEYTRDSTAIPSKLYMVPEHNLMSVVNSLHLPSSAILVAYDRYGTVKFMTTVDN